MAKVLFIMLYEPLYLGTRFLAEYLKEHNHEVHSVCLKLKTWGVPSELVEEHHGYQLFTNGGLTRNSFDMNPITDNELNLLKECIADYAPDIIGLTTRSLHTGLLPRLMPILTSFSPETLLVAGGFGPTLEPELFLDAGFDVVVKAAGEEALLEIANNYKNREDMFCILNTAWKIAGEYKHNSMRPLCRDISSYPLPLFKDSDFTAIDKDRRFKEGEFNSTTQADFEGSYQTLLGRGCIGKCTYCCSGQATQLYKDAGLPVIKRRNRSLDSIFAELKIVKERNYRFIFFYDELFVASLDYMRDFFKRYRKEIDLPFFLYLHYDQMLRHPDIFQLMVDAGFASTGLGIQSGSEEFAKKYYHRTNTNESYIQYAKLLFENDCTAQYQFIGGNCYETEDDFRKTLDLRRQLPFSIHTPHMTQTVSFRLKLFPKVPIIELCPKLVTHPTPVKEWARKALLMDLVSVVSEDVFDELYANKLYHDNPLALQPIYRDEVNKLQLAHYEDLLLKLKGKRVVFYGAGYILEQSYEYFACLKPECILLDERFIKERKFFGDLPIYKVEDFLQKNKDVYILCFSRPGTVLPMVRKLTRRLGIARDKVDICSRELSTK